MLYECMSVNLDYYRRRNDDGVKKDTGLDWWYLHDMWIICEWYLDDIWIICGWYVDDMWMICGWYLGDMWVICGWYLDDITHIYNLKINLILSMQTQKWYNSTNQVAFGENGSANKRSLEIWNFSRQLMSELTLYGNWQGDKKRDQKGY